MRASGTVGNGEDGRVVDEAGATRGSSAPRAARKRRGQVVPGLYLAMAGLAAAIVFPSALRPPPDEATTSAELSPDAPPEDQPEAIIQSLTQAGSKTAGATGQGREEADEEEAATTTTTVKPRRRAVRSACYGNPPRQLEAVYSPGCQPAFVGNNGGATAQGVTATEIRVAFGPDLSGTTSSCGPIPETATPGEDGAVRTYRVLRDYFNQNLELYGRKLRFFYGCAQSGTRGPEAARTRAVAMKGFDVFSAIGEFDQDLPRELRNAGIAYMGNNVVPGDSYFRGLQPFVWGSRAHSTRAVDMSSKYLCDKLAPNKPFPTGDALVDYNAKRRFGLLALSDPSSAESIALLQKQMKERCGAVADVVAEYNLDSNAQGIGTAMTKLATSRPRISTIIFMGEILTLPTQAQVADQQRYFPEWYVMGAGGFETSITLARSISPTQWRNAFGFSFEEIPRRPRSTPCYKAYRSLDPDNDPNNAVCEILFHSMLFTFGAMQEAGPNLTVPRWAAALQRAFTRPPTPEYAMSGGFAATDYTFGDYAVELYWDPTAIHPDGSPGAYRYLNDGERFLSDGIEPGQPKMFEGGITDGDKAGPDGNSFN